MPERQRREKQQYVWLVVYESDPFHGYEVINDAAYQTKEKAKEALEDELSGCELRRLELR